MQRYHGAKIHGLAMLREIAAPRCFKGFDVPLVQHVKHLSPSCDGKPQKPDPMLGSYIVEPSTSMFWGMFSIEEVMVEASDLFF